MKILSAEQIKAADLATQQSEGISSVALMDRAAEVFSARLIELYPRIRLERVLIVCGPGNNGGDGLAVARLLAALGIRVVVFVVAESEKRSADFLIQLDRLKGNEAVTIHILTAVKELDNWLKEHATEDFLIVDAIFGIGLNKAPLGVFAEVIALINTLNKPIVSIDIPSGMFVDTSSIQHRKHIVHAQHTLSFEVPKLAFLFPENAAFLGAWELLSIGLNHEFIENVKVNTHFILREEVRLLLTSRPVFAHKGVFGHAFIVAGSEGKIGAAVLAASACMRSGAGKLTVRLPAKYVSVIHSTLPEAMTESDAYDGPLSEIPLKQAYQAIGIGPGIGTAEETATALKLCIQNYKGPLVLDADALNILAEHKTWLAFLSPGAVLTPHPKEFERLVGKWDNDFEKHQLLINFAVKNRVYVVLKGANTCIAFPDGSTSFNTSGNPGMATAGSGDVLTGLLTGLLAQGYSSTTACILGVYLHGLAGDIAAAEGSTEAMIASDLVRHFGNAFMEIRKIVEVAGTE